MSREYKIKSNREILTFASPDLFMSVSNLEGKMLTIMDASLADTQQRDAVKALIREQLWGWANQNLRDSAYEIKEEPVEHSFEYSNGTPEHILKGNVS